MTSLHSRILRQARSGSIERAWSLMEQHGLLDSDTDMRALTLQARLIKDRAKRADGAKRAWLFGESAAVYARAGALDKASYPLINAASLYFLAGKKTQSEGLARDVLAALDANPDEAETPYWLGATRAEALLLLGQATEARAALRMAVTRQPAAWEDHAATIAQFELLCAELGHAPDWLDQIRPPRTLHYSGIMHVTDDGAHVRAQIDQWFDQENIGFGYGALAAGADIWIAEALIARGSALHLVLPCDIGAFRTYSVSAVDPSWEQRFDDLLDQAESVVCLDHADRPSPPAVRRGEAVAHGMAANAARHLSTSVRHLRINGSEDGRGGAGTGGCKILTVERNTRPSVAPDDAGHSVSAVVRTPDGLKAYSGIDEAWQAVRQSSQPAVLDFQITAAGAAAPQIADRLAAMLECTEPGQIHATHAAAFALLASGADIHVESAGEMRWAGGQLPLYFIA